MDKQDKLITVHSHHMHYVRMGQGDPILFLHGIPTSSYLWRQVMPVLSPFGTCIAPDLIGMGQSDKPKKTFHLVDHVDFVETFIEALQLKNITLVMHGLGSFIGFEYARRHENNIKGLAFYEAYLRPVTEWKALSLPIQQMAQMLSQPSASRKAIIEQNYLVEKLLPRSAINALDETTMAVYRKPFLTQASRELLWQCLQELPLGQAHSPVIDMIKGYSNWLTKTSIPKLLLYAVPGFLTTIEDVQWAYRSLPAIQCVAIENALHMAPETVPDVFSTALQEWYLSCVKQDVTS